MMLLVLPASASFYVANTSINQGATVFIGEQGLNLLPAISWWGATGDIPVVGDWDGDDINTIGVYRDGVFYLRNRNTAGNADLAFAYGTTGDIPVTGKWV